MFERFLPDFIFKTFDEVTPAFLAAEGIRFLLIDIDNTLAPYEEPLPNETIKKWFADLDAAGIRAVLVSNNHRERVELFNEEIGAFITWESKKPSAKSIHMAASHFGVKESEIAIIGDQIFTDIWCARNAGSYAILVVPLKYKENLFFRFKRMCEKPFIRAYKKKNAKSKGDHS